MIVTGVRRTSHPHRSRLGSVSEEDPAAGEVVGAELHEHPVIRQDLDVVLSYFPADVCEYLVPVLEFHPEGGIAQALDDGALDFDASCCFCHQRATNSRLLLARWAPMP